MHAMPLILIVLASLAIAFRFYSTFLAAKVAALDDSRVTRVPGSCGAKVERMRTGISSATAGRMVRGCSTFAPKCASS